MAHLRNSKKEKSHHWQRNHGGKTNVIKKGSEEEEEEPTYDLFAMSASKVAPINVIIKVNQEEVPMEIDTGQLPQLSVQKPINNFGREMDQEYTHPR